MHSDTLSKGEQKMLGIFHFDLNDQKNDISVSKKFQSDEAGKAEEKKFWKKTESWVCHLKENKFYLRAWVENGALQEETGTWSFDESSMVLILKSEKEIWEYKVNFNEKGQIWNPLNKGKEEFNMLFLKRLGL
jgi:hypothetical protein